MPTRRILKPLLILAGILTLVNFLFGRVTVSISYRPKDTAGVPSP